MKSFFFNCYAAHLYLPSFPTRRSSDLQQQVSEICAKCLLKLKRLVSILPMTDRKSGSAGMPRPNSYAVFCLKKKKGRGPARIEHMELALVVRPRPICFTPEQDRRNRRN